MLEMQVFTPLHHQIHVNLRIQGTWQWSLYRSSTSDSFQSLITTASQVNLMTGSV